MTRERVEPGIWRRGEAFDGVPTLKAAVAMWLWRGPLR
jgi:hypothetical protein